MNVRARLSYSIRGYKFTVQQVDELSAKCISRAGGEAIEAFSLVSSAVVLQFRSTCDNHARNGAGSGRLLNRRRR